MERIVFETEMKGDAHVIEHRKGRKQSNILESTGDAAGSNLIGSLSNGGLSGKYDPSGAWWIHSSDQIEDGSLASAIGTDQPNQFISPKLKIQLRNGGQSAKTDRATLDREDILLHRRTHASDVHSSPKGKQALRPQEHQHDQQK